jgi:hypothetical protein
MSAPRAFLTPSRSIEAHAAMSPTCARGVPRGKASRLRRSSAAALTIGRSLMEGRVRVTIDLAMAVSARCGHDLGKLASRTIRSTPLDPLPFHGKHLCRQQRATAAGSPEDRVRPALGATDARSAPVGLAQLGEQCTDGRARHQPGARTSPTGAMLPCCQPRELAPPRSATAPTAAAMSRRSSRAGEPTQEPGPFHPSGRADPSDSGSRASAFSRIWNGR